MFSDFEQNTFHFLAKRFQKGCRTCLYESNRDFWGEFFLIKISTFYDWPDFRMKTFEHSTKKWVELPKLQFVCPAEVFEKKKYLIGINCIFSLGLPEILWIVWRKMFGCVCWCVCVWGWGLPLLRSTCLEKHFERMHFFEKFVVSYFFSIFDGIFSIFLHEILAGLSEPPRRRIWETRLFWRNFKILEFLNFDRKKLVELPKPHLPV